MESHTFDVTLSGTQSSVTTDVSVTGTHASAVTAEDNVTVTGGDITISVAELDTTSAPLTLEFTFTDGDGRIQTLNYNLELENTSGKLARENYSVTAQAIKSWMAMPAESLLFERLYRLTLFGSQSGATLPSTTFAEAVDDELKHPLELLLEEAEANIESYDTGEWEEANFAEAEQALLSASLELATPVNDLLNEAIMSTAGMIPELSLGNIIVNTEAGVASQFIGNEELGSYEDDAWVFFEEYAFLTDIVFADNLICNIE